MLQNGKNRGGQGCLGGRGRAPTWDKKRLGAFTGRKGAAGLGIKTSNQSHSIVSYIETVVKDKREKSRRGNPPDQRKRRQSGETTGREESSHGVGTKDFHLDVPKSGLRTLRTGDVRKINQVGREEEFRGQKAVPSYGNWVL